MSYRIVRITNLYNEYIENYYHLFPDVGQLSFKEQQAHLERHSCDTVTCFTRNMREIGVDAYSIFTNATLLQNQWKLENNCDKSGHKLILEQIKSLKPHVLWLDDFTLIDSDWIANVRENVRSVRLITGHLCAPFNSWSIKNLKALDFLVTCTPCLKEEFEQNGITTYLLYHGFDTNILSENLNVTPFLDTDILFTGSLYTGGGFHKTRIEYLEQFVESQLPIIIYGNIDTDIKIAKKKLAYLVINSMRRRGGDHIVQNIPFLKNYEAYGETPVNLYSRRLKKIILPPVYGLDQFKLLSRAKLCFNIHGEIAKGCAGNARLFEATGMGTCLVTDWKENLKILFEPGKEVITYKSIEECIDKMKWLLQYPSEAEKIAHAGQVRTLRDHSVKKRVLEVNGWLLSKI